MNEENKNEAVAIEATLEVKPMMTLDPEKVQQLVDIGMNLAAAATAKPTLKEKLKSRKFWISIAGVVVGIGGLIGFRDSTTAMIVFVVLQIVSILGYCIAEGYIDAARVKQMLTALGVIGKVIGNDEAIKAEADKALEEFQSSEEEGVVTVSIIEDSSEETDHSPKEDDEEVVTVTITEDN